MLQLTLANLSFLQVPTYCQQPKSLHCRRDSTFPRTFFLAQIPVLFRSQILQAPYFLDFFTFSILFLPCFLQRSLLGCCFLLHPEELLFTISNAPSQVHRVLASAHHNLFLLSLVIFLLIYLQK